MTMWARWMGGPARALLADRDRWALWLPVFFGAGIALYFALPEEPAGWLGAAGVGAALAMGWAVRRRMANPGGIALAGVVALGMVAAGFAVAQWRTAQVAAPVLADRIGPTAVTGRVVHVETFPRGNRVTLDRPRIAGVAPDRVPERVRIRLRAEQPMLGPGDWIRVRAIVSPPPAPSAPGAFDFQRQSFFRQLGAVGFGLGPAEVIASAAETGGTGFAQRLSRLRQAITLRVMAAVPGRTGAVAAALMTGERSAIPGELMDAIRDSGLAHLLAISGLHIGLVAGILFVGLRAAMALAPPLALRHPIKKWAAGAAIAGAFAYALVAGATVPSQRAFLMVGLVLLAVIVDRRALSVRLVAWAALIILALQPESLLSASFQMSFAAVVALVAGYEALARRRRRLDRDSGAMAPWLRRVVVYVSGVALTTLIAGAATAPFAIYHFNRFADFGLFANLLAVPVTALWVMPWAVVAFLLMPLGLEALALTPMGWGVDVVIRVAETVSSLPGAVTLVPSMPTATFALVVLGGLWICLWRGRWRTWGVVALVLGVAVTAGHRPPDMLVDGDGRLMAVRGADGRYMVSTARRAAFEREMWLRRQGQGEKPVLWPVSGTSRDGRLSCDVEGCVYRAGGATLAVAYGESALLEDCWAADVLVALVPVRRRCPGPVAVIDRFDLWRMGAHAVWLERGHVRVLSVNGERGLRPWVVRPDRDRPAKAGRGAS